MYINALRLRSVNCTVFLGNNVLSNSQVIHYFSHTFKDILKTEKMQRPGPETIRTQEQPSKSKEEITKQPTNKDNVHVWSTE